MKLLLENSNSFTDKSYLNVNMNHLFIIRSQNGYIQNYDQIMTMHVTKKKTNSENTLPTKAKTRARTIETLMLSV